MVNNFTKMKNKSFLLILFFATSVFPALAQLPNGDFESWITGTGGFLEPSGFTCSNDQFSSASVFRDTGHTGSYSVKLGSTYDSFNGIYVPGMLQLTHQPFAGSSNPVAITGFWKTYNPQFTDALYLEIHLFDASNNEVGQGDINSPFTGSVLNWTSFSFPITYSSGNAVANFSMDIFWGVLSSDTTTYGNIDDLNFNLGTGIDLPVINPSAFVLQKEPNTNIFHLISSSTTMNPVEFDLFDLSGKILISKDYRLNSSEDQKIDLGSLSSGMYICSLTSPFSNQSVKLILQ